LLDVDGISERERLRGTFDAVAKEYQDARPEYPDPLYEALISLTGVVAGVDELCEVGCASGKATLPLARRGFAISCVELGGALAAEARRTWPGSGGCGWTTPTSSHGRPDRRRGPFEMHVLVVLGVCSPRPRGTGSTRQRGAVLNVARRP
jgi:hypothetical protein